VPTGQTLTAPRNPHKAGSVLESRRLVSDLHRASHRMPPRLGAHHSGAKEGMAGRPRDLFYPHGKTYAQTLASRTECLAGIIVCSRHRCHDFEKGFTRRAPFTEQCSNGIDMDSYTTLSASGYQERFVALLDLLGFKALVEAAERDESQFKRLQEVLHDLSQTLCNNASTGTRFIHFSDCIIITTNATPDALRELFRSIHVLTGNLLQQDVLVRGAITRGGAFHDAQYVYGTAVSRAAVLENTCAKQPLTLISPEVYEDVKALGKDFLQWVEQDGHDRQFVHYLIEFAMYHRLPKLPGTVGLDTDADRVRFQISRRLLNDSGDVLAKAKWFQAYWNRTVARADGFSAIEADARLSEPVGARTNIVRRLVSR
jgi:hypothetical protein